MKRTHAAPASQRDIERNRLREELRTAQRELSSAYRQFNQAVDPDLISCSIYQINAVKARCDYLLRAIKTRQQL